MASSTLPNTASGLARNENDVRLTTRALVGFLCATSVYSVSLWLVGLRTEHHRDTEYTEVAQRKPAGH